MRVKGLVSYDGSHYQGFQDQKKDNINTIQGVIEKLLSSICNEKIVIVGSGRTDKGVHALNQVFHFDMNNYRELNHLKYALNRMLPQDILSQGINLFLGEHEFKNFCSNKEKDSYIRTIYSFTYKLENNQLIFDIIGSGFKRYMVRMIIGTLLALNNHQIDLSYIETRLNDIKKGTTIYNAEPNGLYLVEVFYD